MLDLYLLITQGQYSPNTEFKTIAGGWYITIEEDIIEVPVRRGGSSTDGGDIYYKKKKRIYIKVRLDEGKKFEKEILLENINLSVSNVRQSEDQIIIEVKDTTIENVSYNIIVNPIFD
jgi:hypothetical protein